MNRKMTNWLLTGAMASLIAGCGLEAGPSAFEDQEIDPEEHHENEPPSGILGEGSGAGTMAGTWFKFHEASSCVLGQEQVTHAYYLVDIEEHGAGLREERRLCELEMSAVLGFRPLATREVLSSIQFPHLDYGYMSNLLEGGIYTSSTEVALWGIALDDPVGDSIPVEVDDERVIDGDGDGNPGVSLELEGSGCKRFMGQRQIIRYFGTLLAPNDIRGTSTTLTDIEVYGGSASVCELAPDVEGNDAHSHFRMVRVDGLGGAVDAGSGDATVECDDLAPYIDEIWEPREADDDRCP